MKIINFQCPLSQTKSLSCFSFLGLDYKSYILIIALSIIIGFSANYIYSLTEKKKTNTKKFLKKSSIISLIVFIILTLISFLIRTS